MVQRETLCSIQKDKMVPGPEDFAEELKNGYKKGEACCLNVSPLWGPHTFSFSLGLCVTQFLSPGLSNI